VLTADEARELLTASKTVRKRPDGSEEPALVGLRDRALIGVMVYTFARVNRERLLDEYIVAACIVGDKDGPLFRTVAGRAESVVSDFGLDAGGAESSGRRPAATGCWR
jgi:hypothetical protein